MKTTLLLTLVCLAIAALTQAQHAERSMKVELPKSKADAVFGLREAVSFNIVVFARSVEDRNTMEGLTVDDWRYDEPNYFADGRVPNVVLHVERKQPDGRWMSIPFRASSQGGGGNLERLVASLDIEAFPSSSNIEAAMLLKLAKNAIAAKKSEDVVKQEMAELRNAFRAEAVGEFRLTAAYTGYSTGEGRIILKAPPVEFKIQAPP